MEIVINKCFGGFSVSKIIFDKFGLKWDGCGFLSNGDFGITDDNPEKYRSNPRLIKAIKEVGCEKASGNVADLEIKEIPDGTDFTIEDYDGMESIHEKHRIWR